VFCVKFDTYDPNFVISGGWDNNVKVWDIRTAAVVRSIYGPYTCGDAVDVSNDCIMTGSYRDSNPLQLWDYKTCELLADINWDDGLPSEKPCLLYTC
jgi:COMPASS component SWD3